MTSYIDLMKDYRRDNNLTTGQFAELVGISQSLVSLIENGKRNPSITVLEKLSNFFNVPVDVMISSTSNNNYIRNRNLESFVINGELGNSKITATINIEFDESKMSDMNPDFYKQMFYHLEKTYIIEIIRKYAEQNLHQANLELIDRLKSDMEDYRKEVVEQIKMLEAREK